MTHDEMIEVIAAHRDGKGVEVSERSPTRDNWRVAVKPAWDFSDYKYRVKPEPPTCYANIYPHSTTYGYETKQAADSAAGQSRIRCVKMTEAEDQS